MSITQQKEALENALRHFNFPEKYFIDLVDKKFSISIKTPYSTNNISEFMNYRQMNCYLIGYNKAQTKPFI